MREWIKTFKTVVKETSKICNAVSRDKEYPITHNWLIYLLSISSESSTHQTVIAAKSYGALKFTLCLITTVPLEPSGLEINGAVNVRLPRLQRSWQTTGLPERQRTQTETLWWTLCSHWTPGGRGHGTHPRCPASGKHGISSLNQTLDGM